MIREINNGERDGALTYLLGDSGLDPEEAAFFLKTSDKVLVYETDSHETVGCGTFRLWGEQKNNADVYIYVSPEARNNGIGELLLNALTAVPVGYKLDYFSTKAETALTSSVEFFRRRGFDNWYTELIMTREGERFPDSDMKFVNYDSRWFERYVDALRDCFYELRKANDFKPYYCCEPNGEKREELEKNKEKIYILPDGENIVASVIVDSDSIDDVFVTREYRRRGIGRDTVRFAVNKAIDSGETKLQISAIEWNKTALRLYESLGFQREKPLVYLRRRG